jgi:hypothetical protein
MQRSMNEGWTELHISNAYVLITGVLNWEIPMHEATHPCIASGYHQHWMLDAASVE